MFKKQLAKALRSNPIFVDMMNSVVDEYNNKHTEGIWEQCKKQFAETHGYKVIDDDKGREYLELIDMVKAIMRQYKKEIQISFIVLLYLSDDDEYIFAPGKTSLYNVLFKGRRQPTKTMITNELSNILLQEV